MFIDYSNDVSYFNFAVYPLNVEKTNIKIYLIDHFHFFFLNKMNL